MPLRELARAVDLEQMVGNILHGLLRLCARTRPVRRTHAVQAWRCALRADVLLQEADLICRHEELVVSAVLNAQVVAVHTCHLERLHPEVLPNAV